MFESTNRNLLYYLKSLIAMAGGSTFESLRKFSLLARSPHTYDPNAEAMIIQLLEALAPLQSWLFLTAFRTFFSPTIHGPAVSRLDISTENSMTGIHALRALCPNILVLTFHLRRTNGSKHGVCLY
jgi:hypothetical protein